MSSIDAPWILLSQCGIGSFSPNARRLVGVACPSWLCSGLVPLVDGKIVAHHVREGERCPWSGTRVVDDRSAFTSSADDGSR
ncbi:hypothetical protein [Nocardia africana]|uniref:Transposase n=1 Tax=Nocardia africana TaxID=134964 RepID=A0ABW6NLU2_9NOCA